ncbi:MAG TPA: hypothetical protein VIV15_09770, partial [Anaerolineales bacterium]
MDEASGWLLDVYADEAGGVTLWLLADDGRRLRLHMDFAATFYAAGDLRLLRQAWMLMKDKEARLERTTRRDLFLGERDVLAVTTSNPAGMQKLFAELQQRFPSLDYYDADIPLSLRFIARTEAHLLGRCRIMAEAGHVESIEPLDSPWEIDPAPMPLRILTLTPDCNPVICRPRSVRVQHGRAAYNLQLDPLRVFMIGLKADLKRLDPDLILTDYGDTWLFPQLKKWSQETGIELNPNRDESRQVLTRRADSYFAYGQVVYRGAQAHLWGRWHVDRR